MCARQSDNSFVNLLNGVVSGQPSYGRYSVSTASAASSLHPAARDHGTSSARADQSFGSGWRAEARAKVQSSRVFSHQFAKPVVKSNGYFYGSPKKNAGYGGHHASYFNKGNRSTTSNNPTFNNRSNWNKTYSNNQATSFGHESGWNGRSHGYHGGASVTHTFRNRSMTGMEFVHGRGNVQSMNFTVFQHMNSNSSEQQATSSGYSNVHQPGHVLNGDNYEHGRNQTRLTVSQLFGRPEETEVPIHQIHSQQGDLEGLTEQFDQLVHQQSAGRSTTPPFDHSDPRVGTSGGTFEDDGQETHIGMGTPLMRLSAFEREMNRRNSATSLPDGNSIQSRKSSPVTADNDVKSNGGVSSSGHTLQPSKQVTADAPSTSGQAGKRRRRRNRSKKSSKTNKSFDADVTIGNRYDDSQMFNGLDETIADKPTGGFTVSQSASSNENTPLGFSTRPSKFDQLQCSVKKGIHPMMIPEFKGQRTDKASAASSSNRQWDRSPCNREDELSGSPFQSLKEAPIDASNVSVQEEKPKKRRNRSRNRKSFKANQSFSADKTVGSYKDDSQYSDDSISDEPTEGFTVFQNMDSQFKGLTNTRKSTSPILNLTMDDAPTAFDVTLPEPNLNQTFSGILKVGKKNIRPKSVVFGKFPTPLARSETFAELHPPRSPSVRAGWKNSAKLINLEAIEVELYDEYVGIYKALTCTDKMRQMPEIVVDKDTIYYCIEGTDELLELPPTFEFNLYPVEELPSGIVMAGRYKYMFDDENDALGKLLKTVCKASMRTQWTQSNLPELMLKNRVTRIAPVKVLPTVDDCLVPDEELSASDRCLRKFFLKKYRNEPASPGTDIPDEVVDPFSPIDLTKGRKIAEMEGMPHQRNGFWHMKEASPKERSPVEDQNDVSRHSKLPVMLPKRVKVGRAEYALPKPRVGDLHTFSPECIANNSPSSEPTCSNVPLGDMLSTPTKLASPSMFNPLASSTPRKDSDSEMNGGVVRRLRDPMDDIPSTSGPAVQSSSRLGETPKIRKPKDREPKDHWMCQDGLKDPPSSD
ncbi:hypothetical protein CAEBREN_08678 [Caenorhabditis brenneri]|uniref:Uncharacterized protein n=1 Tax=Caenorhabditis brenneri TaxID=135651 RepID=G0MHB9_CAEBE|nr:hypothetical protein CAEBREN_08678 [Caenorhabditis brenneri]